MKDIVGLNDGHNPLLVNVHTVDRCAGQPCCIHNPTQHHMADWRPSWDDRAGTMWRVCPHLIRHPDPDDLAYLRRIYQGRYPDGSWRVSHMCDGCCQPGSEEIKAIEGATDGRD